jgi:glyoxylase-like metal-dependent hydrolase (beta-lactamase superfamily II)
MRLGDVEFHMLHDGRFRLDGGAMFGVIPRPMWERVLPADERNRVILAMNSLLIRAGGKNILVETGAGEKWDERRRDIFAFEGQPRLLGQLAARGLTPEKIDIVVNTHLHFDHCGWNTRIVNGMAVPTFANAQYVVQRGELEHAHNPTERDRASYIPDNFEPMEASGQWRLLDRDEEIVPGVELLRMPGHTADMMGVRLSGGGETAVLFADLVPTRAHLPPAWVMGYDSYPLTTLENKKKWLADAVRNRWIALFGHDVQVPAARLRESGGKISVEPVVID